jgi:hypothetical protein
MIEVAPGITDHALAEKLREYGWDGTTQKNNKTAITYFYNSQGKVIATVVYDDQKSIKKAVFMARKQEPNNS